MTADGLLRERMNNLAKACLFLALVFTAFLAVRSAIIAAEKAKALETRLVDLETAYQTLRQDTFVCYDELAWHRQRAARRDALPKNRGR